MGCRPSKLQIQHNGDLFDEDINVKRKFITGLHLTCEREGADFSTGICKVKTKKYEKVATIPAPEQNQIKEYILYSRIDIKFLCK